MAKNDSIILDSIIDERVSLKIPSDKRDEAFEYFVIEEILKDFTLKKEELSDGLVDGMNDGGIDAIFITINGHCLTDVESFFWPKSNVELEVFIVTCKHNDSFKQAPLDSMVATLSELMDFAINTTALKGNYNNEILKKRELLNIAYRKVASRLTSFAFEVYYASRGDSNKVAEPILARANQITEILKNSFDNSIAKFHFWGSNELVESFRKKPNFSLELPFIEYLGRGERYVLLCTLVDYYNFITDEDKKLRRYLFDSNVRDFMGLNSVNEDIKATLANTDSPDFWWLNNGVTILATSGRVIGESIQIEDIQIVNGLQTTESIYNHFISGKLDPNNRSVLVKILVSNDGEIRDSIIRATNNQTTVQTPALHATDKIQRDIEDILLTSGLYYERRTNYYINRNIPTSLIVSPLYIAAAFVALVKKDPFSATGLKSKFMRKPISYTNVFTPEINILIWPAVAKILKKCDEILEKNRIVGKPGNDGFLKKWRHVLALLSVARKFGDFSYNINQLVELNTNSISDDDFNENWNFIKRFDVYSNQLRLKNKAIVDNILSQAAEEFNISGIDSLKIKTAPDKSTYVHPFLTDSFINEVNSNLPEQPWKSDTISEVAQKMNSNPKNVSTAITVLVQRGVRYKQRQGIVYDHNKKIIAIDSDLIDKDKFKMN